MFLVATILSVIVAAWVASPSMSDGMTWEAYLPIQSLIVSLAVTAWFFEIRKCPVIYRSLVVLLAMTLWLDTVSHVMWMASSHWIDTGAALFVGLCAGVIYLTTRKYDIEGDEVTGDNVFILFLRPRSNAEIIKSFFGAPVSSVCVYCKGRIWSYRNATRRYERMIANEAMISHHIAFDTGIPVFAGIIAALNANIGKPRGYGVRCVWVLKDVLRMLDLAPKSFMHYIPGIYADQLLRKV